MYSINASLFWSTNRTPCGIVLAMQICVWTHPRCLWACVCLQAYAARRNTVPNKTLFLSHTHRYGISLLITSPPTLDVRLSPLIMNMMM